MLLSHDCIIQHELQEMQPRKHQCQEISQLPIISLTLIQFTYEFQVYSSSSKSSSSSFPSLACGHSQSITASPETREAAGEPDALGRHSPQLMG